MIDREVIQSLALSLGIGLLIGLQRQRTQVGVGIRTFPLITLFGTICGWLAIRFDGWIIAAGLVAVAAVFVIGTQAGQRHGETEFGETTEVAALLLYGLGAYLVIGNQGAAVVVAGVAVILLHLKEPMHRFVEKMGEHDMRALMQFVVITLIVLPLLPNKTYGPLNVLNPREIWMMVVLIVGISLCGYVAYKLLGEKIGTLLGGVLGGLVSSTATTVSFSRRARQSPEASSLAALVIMIASTIAFVRVLIEVSVVAPTLFRRVAPPLVAMLLLMAGLSAAVWFFARKQDSKTQEPGNPAEFKSALVFGALYALVLLAVAAARNFYGSSGLYVVAVISGLTDLDAITLSTASLMNQNRVDTNTGWRLILIAALANLVFKGGMVAALGSRRLMLFVWLLFGIAIACGLLMVFLWPAGWSPSLGVGAGTNAIPLRD